MKKNDVEKILRKNRELVPIETLKNKVYDASLQVVSTEEHSRASSSLIKKMTFIFAPVMTLILCCVLVGIGLGNEKYRSIYIDINPSVEIIVNRFDYIVDVNYLNEDAISEYTDVALKGEKIEKAINNILEKLEINGYLENKEMIISVVSKNNSDGEKILKDVKNKVNDYIQKKGKEIVVEGKTHSKEEKEAAEKHQLSPAKYKLIEYILKLDETSVLENLKNMTVEELAELLNELSGEKIEEILEKPFAPKEEKPFGDVDFDSIKNNKPKPEKHVCTEECPEDCQLAKPNPEKHPEFDKEEKNKNKK